MVWALLVLAVVAVFGPPTAVELWNRNKDRQCRQQRAQAFNEYLDGWKDRMGFHD